VWIHVPSNVSACAPVERDSISASDWLFPTLEQSAGWNGKLMPSRSWYAACRKVRWMTRLCGQISEPSTASRGVEQWIASLRDTRASHSPMRVSDLAKTIRDTFGLTSNESWSRLARRTSCARTLTVISLWGSSKSMESYENWASRLRLLWSARQMWRQTIDGNDFSSWPTIKATDADHSGPNQRDSAGNPALAMAADQWQTPTGSMIGSRRQVGATEREDLLPKQATNWIKPSTDDRPTKNKNRNLGFQVDNWDGPALSSQTSAKDSPTTNVSAQIAESTTPNAHALDQQKMTLNTEKSTAFSLGGDWPTLGANDHKGTAKPGQRRGQLDEAAEQKWNSPPTHQSPATTKDGGESSKSTKRLNRRFVCWLMGWPMNWSDIDATNCGYSETELFLRRRRWRLRALLHSLTK
jgi:hypothetical protein